MHRPCTSLDSAYCNPKFIPHAQVSQQWIVKRLQLQVNHDQCNVQCITVNYFTQKHVFEPPHRRVEANEERQREIEHAFEDMYMAQTSKQLTYMLMSIGVVVKVF